VVVVGCGAVHQQGKSCLGLIKKRGLSEQHMCGIYIIFTTKSIGDVVVWPFVWFVVARQRKKRLGFIIVAHASSGDYQSSTCVVFHYFKQEHWRQTSLLVWPFVWFVVVFGFGAVHPQRTRHLGFIVVYTQKAVVIRAEQHMCGIYIIFSTKSLGRRCCWFGRLFGLWLRSVVVLYYIHRQRKRPLGIVA